MITTPSNDSTLLSFYQHHDLLHARGCSDRRSLFSSLANPRILFFLLFNIVSNQITFKFTGFSVSSTLCGLCFCFFFFCWFLRLFNVVFKCFTSFFVFLFLFLTLMCTIFHFHFSFIIQYHWIFVYFFFLLSLDDVTGSFDACDFLDAKSVSEWILQKKFKIRKRKCLKPKRRTNKKYINHKISRLA